MHSSVLKLLIILWVNLYDYSESQLLIPDRSSFRSNENGGEQIISENRVHNSDSGASLVKLGEFPWYAKHRLNIFAHKAHQYLVISLGMPC